jgi:hypothetical protein
MISCAGCYLFHLEHVQPHPCPHLSCSALSLLSLQLPIALRATAQLCIILPFVCSSLHLCFALLLAFPPASDSVQHCLATSKLGTCGNVVAFLPQSLSWHPSHVICHVTQSDCMTMACDRKIIPLLALALELQILFVPPENTNWSRSSIAQNVNYLKIFL